MCERKCQCLEEENFRMREENERLRDELRFLRTEVGRWLVSANNCEEEGCVG